MAGTSIISKVNGTLSIRETDASGLALSATCTGAPPTTAGTFAHGCQIIQTDSGTGTKATYENVGSSAVPSWNLMGDVTAGEITLATGSILVGTAGVAAALDAKTSGRILVGSGTTLASVAVSGDATLSSAGVLTVANTTGLSGLFAPKIALLVYDFAVDGGAISDITPSTSPTIPDNAVVWLESYDVLTTVTTAGADAGTIKLSFATDGDLTTALAVSDALNAWDAGVHLASRTALQAGILPVAVKLTAARQPRVTIATQAVTAGKIVFQLRYWVSQ